ncbi:MAG: bifunctional folylpolyglutamate synthase/dihydrofolate synthase [Bacteroidota bacterium]
MFPNTEEAIRYLNTRLPFFQRVGAAAYNPGLGKTLALLDAIGNPQVGLKYIHVAGTNGKGSCSHMLAAILQSAGYRTGLFTSPHMKSVTERIRVNGREISSADLLASMNRLHSSMEALSPSFFEVTVALALDHFCQQEVDIAVLETGLGGRLDATNVVIPEVSLITNIGHDHMDILGDTLSAIAGEKAGIIKQGVPVLIGERVQETESVFKAIANERGAPLKFASDLVQVAEMEGGSVQIRSETIDLQVNPQLNARYQYANIAAVVAVIEQLRGNGYQLSDDAIRTGLEQVNQLTGLRGRWQQIGSRPLVICDTGHNPEGIAAVLEQISRTPHKKLWWVFGVVGDKDPGAVLKLLPTCAHYFFCQAPSPRAMDARELFEKASNFGLSGRVVADVNEALMQARESAAPDDLVLVGGSTYVVAEVRGI